MELINVQKNIVPVLAKEEKVIETSDGRFIVANTSPIAFNDLKHGCIIPVFAKDNECTLSHHEFVEEVGEVCADFFNSEKILSPAIRVSHPIKGRIPEAMNKPADKLLEHEKTLYYERMAFIFEIPSISSVVNGNQLTLCVGGVRSLNHENLYGKKSEERFKVFIGFKNFVCTNLCVSTDGFLADLKVMSSAELFNKVFQLVKRFDAENQLQMLKIFPEYRLTEKMFAQLIGRSRLFNYLPPKQKRNIEQLPLSDTQISLVAKDYYQDRSFCRSEDGDIDMWKLYNLFTSASKTSYIDSFLERNIGSYVFISELIKHLRNSTSSWYLS
jgi:hypothetical protein